MTKRQGHKDFLPGIELWTLDRKNLLDHISSLINSGQGAFIITLNPVMVMEHSRIPEFEKALDEAEIIVTDGRGIRWAARKLQGYDPPLIPGVELAEDIIALAAQKSWPVALIGAEPGVWEKAKDNLSEKYPGLNVVGGHHGYFEKASEAELIGHLASLKPLIIVAGMGFPRQEIFLSTYREKFPGAVLIGVGGSLDVYSGIKKRAPAIFRKLGIEWLWRMVCEPKRIRQLALLAKFWMMVQIRHKSLLK